MTLVRGFDVGITHLFEWVQHKGQAQADAQHKDRHHYHHGQDGVHGKHDVLTRQLGSAGKVLMGFSWHGLGLTDGITVSLVAVSLRVTALRHPVGGRQ